MWGFWCSTSVSIKIMCAHTHTRTSLSLSLAASCSKCIQPHATHTMNGQKANQQRFKCLGVSTCIWSLHACIGAHMQRRRKSRREKFTEYRISQPSPAEVSSILKVLAGESSFIREFSHSRARVPVHHRKIDLCSLVWPCDHMYLVSKVHEGHSDSHCSSRERVMLRYRRKNGTN